MKQTLEQLFIFFRQPKTFIVVFAVIVLAQLYIPASMISSQQAVLTNGAVHKLLTAPLDPYDPFRGRYVSLSFAIEEQKLFVDQFKSFSLPDEIDAYQDFVVYVLLAKGEDGFSFVKDVSFEKPPQDKVHENNASWLKAKADFRWSNSKDLKTVDLTEAAGQSVQEATTNADDATKKEKQQKRKILRITFPFDEFYLNEKLAKKAEELYQKASLTNTLESQRAGQKTYAVVKVYEQKAVLEDLFINGVEVNELVEKVLEQEAEKSEQNAKKIENKKD